MSDRSSGGTECERCPSLRGRSTEPYEDVLGHDWLCPSCLKELVPEKWPAREVVA